MPRLYLPSAYLDTDATHAALDALDAADLRAVLRELVPCLTPTTHALLSQALLERAARSDSFMPVAPSAADVAATLAFASTSARRGQAEPFEMDAHLQRAIKAFLARDYPTALKLYRALLLPLAEGEIYLGEREMLDEVLGTDPQACERQFLVALYMTTPVDLRAQATWEVLQRGSLSFATATEPLKALAQGAIDPLPDYPQFLLQWRSLIEAACAAGATARRLELLQRLRQEVATRLDHGPAGLDKGR